MTIYNLDSKICDPVFRNPSVISLINRFGIFLGVGDKSIGDVCRSKGIDPVFFLAVVNTYLNDDYFPEKFVGSFSLADVVDYLAKTDNYYLFVQLPNIERHFNLLMSKSGNDGNLSLLRGFFEEVRNEMKCFISNDENVWFPIFRRFGNASEVSAEDIPSGIPFPYDNHTLQDKLLDLISFFVVHLKGEYDHNLCVAVVSAIMMLEKDVRQNNRIRDRILRPIVERHIEEMGVSHGCED